MNRTFLFRVIGASVLVSNVFLIPNNVPGSEPDYNKVDQNKSQVKITNQN